MATYQHQYRVMFDDVGRAFADLEPVSLSADPEVWRMMAIYFSSRRYLTSTGSVTVAVDWQPVIDEIVQINQLPTVEWLALPREQQQAGYPGSFDLTFEIAERTTRKQRRDHIAYVEFFLHEAYLLANIAVPGAFSTVATMLDGPSGNQIELDGSVFEDAWLEALRNGWPTITPLSLQRVTEWYKRLALSTQQLATSRAAKAMFSLLHVSRMERAEPTAVIWLAQCLESLFDVPHAASFGSLLSRIPSLLGSPPSDKWFRRELRLFVDARNAFAHGGAEVLHPMAHDGLDPRVNDWAWRWMNTSDFALSIIVAALQRHVENAWTEVRWEECLTTL